MGGLVNIRKMRLKHCMTQAELGEAIDISDKSVSAWENGNAVPRNKVLQRMAELFQVSPSYLMGWTDDPTERRKR